MKDTHPSVAKAEADPFTPVNVTPVQPQGNFVVVQKTAGDLFVEFPSTPKDLCKSMADYLNSEFAKGRLCVGSLGDSTNHFFIFTGK